MEISRSKNIPTEEIRLSEVLSGCEDGEKNCGDKFIFRIYNTAKFSGCLS